MLTTGPHGPKGLGVSRFMREYPLFEMLWGVSAPQVWSDQPPTPKVTTLWDRNVQSDYNVQSEYNVQSKYTII